MKHTVAWCCGGYTIALFKTIFADRAGAERVSGKRKDKGKGKCWV